MDGWMQNAGILQGMMQRGGGGGGGFPSWELVAKKLPIVKLLRVRFKVLPAD